MWTRPTFPWEAPRGFSGVHPLSDIRPTFRPEMSEWRPAFTEWLPTTARVSPEVVPAALEAPTVAGVGLQRVGISQEQAAKRLRADSTQRESAVIVFASFLREFAEHSALAQKMQAEGESFAGQPPSIVAVLVPKKTETVRKRAGSLRLFLAWWRSSGSRGSHFRSSLCTSTSTS